MPPSENIQTPTDLGGPLTAANTKLASFSFDTFVPADCNRLALKAAKTVAKYPGVAYPFLYLYGPTSVGKTHLLRAIAHALAVSTPSSAVICQTAADFCYSWQSASQSKTIVHWRHSLHRQAAILLDDIEGLTGNQPVMEHLSQLFDSPQSGRQLVVCCSRPPSRLTDWPEALVSRLSSGLAIQINPPSLETRSLIVRQKARLAGLDLPISTATELATATTDLRVAEGLLIRVIAQAAITNSPITTDLVASILDCLGVKPAVITIQGIIQATAEVFGFTSELLCSASRERPLVVARQTAMYLCRELTSFSFPAIGRKFGDRDHTTVISACKKIHQLELTDQHLQARIQEIKNRLLFQP